MAKAPRRRRGGRGREDRGRKPAKPPAAKPVKPVKPAKPPAARPVKPPAAKPVKPPAAKPVKPPAAQPVQPPAAKPVQPPAAQPAKPPAARPVAPPARSPEAQDAPAAPGRGGRERAGTPKRGGRMAEQEVGRRGRAGGRGGRGGGMGLGAKVGLLAALVTFVVLGATVFATSMAGEDGERSATEFGYAAVSILTAPDARWWRGGGDGDSGLDYIQRKVEELFGEKGESWWEERVKTLTQPVPRELEGTFGAEELEREKKQFEKAVKRLSGGRGPTGERHVLARLGQIWNAMGASSNRRFVVHRAWLTDAQSDKLLASNLSDTGSVQTTGSWNERGAGYAWIEGKVDGAKVRIFRGPIRATKPDDRMTAYVSVLDRGGDDGPGMAVGLAMLLLGPLLVGFTAYGVAGGHSKNVRALAREIDRLGSHGDPDRQLRAQGAEAAAIARSVERMVSNLEFRDKHEGEDLDEIASREQKIAAEIHGALSNKKPPRLQNYEVETLFKPGFEIGGDHFEYFQVDDDHLGVMILDTNVRGIPAALVMSATRSYVRAEAPGNHSPAEVLKRVNRHIADELPAGRHVTAIYVVLDQRDGSATIASAGHLPLLVYRHQAGKMAKVNPEGIAMGLDAGPVFDNSLQEGDIPLGVGDRIVLYTDGALRIQNAEGEEFGEQRFYAAVTNEAPKNSQAFVNFVGAAIDRFHLDTQQNDDITISTVKRLR